ncbi:hypothetical protein NDU88_001531 [Pleurodeles waltl]|uniref:Uncharacterized protein n=1 Tax=Pleurodeles waltl TaxID=8319 RepID=A0AAV7WMQ9_PLEWA|nr:hypothetical protein NDU88_001531 [Pleurodeles waltl]
MLVIGGRGQVQNGVGGRSLELRDPWPSCNLHRPSYKEETLRWPFPGPRVIQEPNQRLHQPLQPPQSALSSPERIYPRWRPSMRVEVADESRAWRCRIVAAGAVSGALGLVGGEERGRQSPREMVARALGTALTARDAWRVG